MNIDNTIQTTYLENRTYVRIIQVLLTSVVPAVHVIPLQEYRAVQQQLSQWERKMTTILDNMEDTHAH